MKIEEQERVLKNDKKNMIVSASAGSGKTYVLIQYICKLVVEKRVPIKNMLILTFTVVASNEMKDRLLTELKKQKMDDFILAQIDDLATSNISTIHSFCEYCLKKYANILKINENFAICDENLANKLKIFSLKKVLKDMQGTADYELISTLFQNNTSKTYDAVFKIENMVNSVSNEEEYIGKIQNGQEDLFLLAEKIAVENIDETLKGILEEFEKLHFDNLKLQFSTSLGDIFQKNSLLEKIKRLNLVAFPKLPKKDEILESEMIILQGLKKDFEGLVTQLNLLDLDEEVIESEKRGESEKALLRLYLAYRKEYENEKRAGDFLDFADLEKYMLKLSSLELFNEKYDFVFIDEYQDTNALQERIVKKVAKDGNFVAVGDAKQGIYGFRLATSAIFLKDIEDFARQENGQVVYLKSNFRSDEKILNFVNDIFKDTMTLKNANIDYASTSMLVSMKEYKSGNDIAVNVDIVKPNEKQTEFSDIYSVQEALLSANVNETELKTIMFRIDEALKSKIYDADLQKERAVRFSDIAILSRGRDPFFNKLGQFLTNHGYPVHTSAKLYLLDEPEIMVLLNLLKITLDKSDDVALASVLMSAIGKFSQEDMFHVIKICENKKMQKLYEKIEKNAKFSAFFELFDEFKADACAYGYFDAFNRLFSKVGYFSYIYSRENGEILFSYVQKFLNEIKSCGYDYDLPNLIAYFDNVQIEVGESVASDDAILLTTIHKTKGLEYPIVMLISCDKTMVTRKTKGEILLDSDLGIAVKRIDDGKQFDTLKKYSSTVLAMQKNMQEEMMVLYVALTRAKNKLYLFGEKKISENINKLKLNSYFDFVLNLLLPEEIDMLIDGNSVEKNNMKINIIEEVENFEVAKNEKIYSKIDEKIAKNLQKYLNWEYSYKIEQNISLKNSVTSLTKMQDETSVFLPNSNHVKTTTNAIEIGNAYHLAMKVVDFEKIKTVEDVKMLIEKSDALSGVRELLDAKVLFDNIIIMQKFCKGDIYKEKEFIMKEELKELVPSSNCDERVLVQGVVDFFAVQGGKAVLVDYKFSNEKNAQVLLGRYSAQLKMYRMALVDGLGVEVENMWILNLKYGNLIEVKD